MLSEKTTPLQTQYVIGRDDLADVINEIVDARIQRFYDEKKKEAEADQLIKPKEAAEQLDVNLTTLWRWYNEGYLKKVYVGSKPRYKQSDIDRIKQKGVQL